MKRIIAGAMVLSILTTSSMAYNDFYIGLGTAMEMVEGANGTDDTGVSMELKVGKIIDGNFGIEGKLSKTISTTKVDIPAESGYFYPDVELDIMSYSIWAMYHYQLTDNLTISPKIGFQKDNIDVTFNDGSSTDIDDSGVVVGLEIKKHLLTSGFDIYAGIEHISKDVNHLTFGVQKNF